MVLGMARDRTSLIERQGRSVQRLCTCKMHGPTRPARGSHALEMDSHYLHPLYDVGERFLYHRRCELACLGIGRGKYRYHLPSLKGDRSL